MDQPVRSSARRLWLHGAIVLAAGALAGCPPVKPGPTTMPAAIDPGTAPVIGTEPTSGGIFAPLGTYTPLTGDALAKARLDRAAILAATRSAPALTSQPASRPAPPAAGPGALPSASDREGIPEAPPLAIKYYLQGREKFLEGANSEAMDDLDKALALDPNAFTVLRLMGRVCFAASQLARGSLFLQRAYAIDPDDVEVNYLLGRYWLERSDNTRAVAHLLQADDSPERSITSAETPLVSFYLARALQTGGYYQAAAAEYERFLETIRLPVAGYRYDRELNYLMEEAWAAHLSAAENLALIGNYRQALPHYLVALHHDPQSSFLLSRMVNCEVHVGDVHDAEIRALALVADSHGSEDSIKLLAWTYRAGGREKDLLADLQKRAHEAPAGDAAPAETLAAAQDYLGQKTAALQTLRSYLENHPTDMDVLSRLLARADSPESFEQVLEAAGSALQKAPGQNEAILKLFEPLAENAVAAQWVRQNAASPVKTRAPFAAYLAGETYQAQRNMPLAEASFQAALAARDFFPAREALVSALIVEEKYQEASSLIQDAIAHHEGGAKAYQLLIESEGAQERLASALKIAADANARFPDNPELQLQLAMVYRLRGEDDKAGAQLGALIDAHPQYEQAYKVFINVLFARAREDGRDSDALQAKAVTYLRRLLQEIPSSVYGRVTAALLNARTNLEDSEARLRILADENPADLEILVPLAQIREALGHPEDALATLETPLKSHPSPGLAEALADLMRQQDKTSDAIALTRRLMEQNLENPAYVIVHTSELWPSRGRRDARESLTPVEARSQRQEALKILASAVEKFPSSQPIALELARIQGDSDQALDAVATMKAFIQRNGETPQRLYLLSHFQSAAGQVSESEETLRRLLVIMPDHPGANNDLGFSWADRGVNLDQAQTMIGKALDNEPNNAAFIDSLGWVCYKQGRFARAITLLEKAIALPGGMEPEVVQHLGDALFRAGRIDDAAERWVEARTLLSDEPGARSHESEKIRSYLEAALAAVKAGNVPAVSPLGERPGVQSADPATAPATLTGRGPTTMPSAAPH